MDSCPLSILSMPFHVLASADTNDTPLVCPMWSALAPCLPQLGVNPPSQWAEVTSFREPHYLWMGSFLSCHIEALLAKGHQREKMNRCGFLYLYLSVSIFKLFYPSFTVCLTLAKVLFVNVLLDDRFIYVVMIIISTAERYVIFEM